MKKLLLVLCCVLGVLIDAAGSRLAPLEALYRAEKMLVSMAQPCIINDYRLKWSSQSRDIYVFDDSIAGNFLVLGGDDSCPAVIGYGKCFGHELPPALLECLESVDISRFYNSGSRSRITTDEWQDIPPLVSAEWGQRYPYNGLTPELESGDRAVAGCVAVAMAQLMSRWKYPVCGSGSIEYWAGRAGLWSFDFESNPFDWNNMLMRYPEDATAAQNGAVASLVAACGAACRTLYGAEGSGSGAMDAAMGLYDYLGYDDGMLLKDRTFYTLDEWTALLYGELALGRPILYTANSDNMGHTFLCDGYESRFGQKYFHINWGWDGDDNGYFMADLLNPEHSSSPGGRIEFDSMHNILVGICPEDGYTSQDMELQSSLDLSTRKTKVALGEEVEFNAVIKNNGVKAVEGYFGVKLMPDNGGNPVYLMSTEKSVVEPFSDQSGFSVNGTAAVPYGSYTVRPAFFAGERWIDVRSRCRGVRSLTVNVSEDGLVFGKAPLDNYVQVSDVVLSDVEVVLGEPFAISATFESYGYDEQCTVYPALMDSYGQVVARMSGKELDLSSGESVDMVWEETFGGQLPPGIYNLRIKSGKYTSLESPSINLQVVEVPSPPLMRISEPMLNGNPAQSAKIQSISGTILDFSVMVTGARGVYEGEVFATVLDADERVICTLGEPVRISLGYRDTEQLSFVGDLDHLDPQAGYFLWLNASCNDEEPQRYGRYLFKVPMATVDDVVAEQGCQEYYTLTGIKLESLPNTPGIYIVKRGKAVSKMIITK